MLQPFPEGSSAAGNHVPGLKRGRSAGGLAQLSQRHSSCKRLPERPLAPRGRQTRSAAPRRAEALPPDTAGPGRAAAAPAAGACGAKRPLLRGRRDGAAVTSAMRCEAARAEPPASAGAEGAGARRAAARGTGTGSATGTAPRGRASGAPRCARGAGPDHVARAELHTRRARPQVPANGASLRSRSDRRPPVNFRGEPEPDSPGTRPEQLQQPAALQPLPQAGRGVPPRAAPPGHRGSPEGPPAARSAHEKRTPPRSRRSEAAVALPRGARPCPGGWG